VDKLSKKIVGVRVMRFGGGHHKQHDWRDDP